MTMLHQPPSAHKETEHKNSLQTLSQSGTYSLYGKIFQCLNAEEKKSMAQTASFFLKAGDARHSLEMNVRKSQNSTDLFNKTKALAELLANQPVEQSTARPLQRFREDKLAFPSKEEINQISDLLLINMTPMEILSFKISKLLQLIEKPLKIYLEKLKNINIMDNTLRQSNDRHVIKTCLQIFDLLQKNLHLDVKISTELNLLFQHFKKEVCEKFHPLFSNAVHSTFALFEEDLVFLLDMGADINFKPFSRRRNNVKTPLEMAIRSQNISAIRFCIAFKATITADSIRRLPYDRAIVSEFYECMGNPELKEEYVWTCFGTADSDLLNRIVKTHGIEFLLKIITSKLDLDPYYFRMPILQYLCSFKITQELFDKIIERTAARQFSKEQFVYLMRYGIENKLTIKIGAIEKKVKEAAKDNQWRFQGELFKPLRPQEENCKFILSVLANPLSVLNENLRVSNSPAKL